MNLSNLLILILTGAGCVYFPWQQNRILEQQNRIIAAQEGQSDMIPAEQTRKLAWLKRYWPSMISVLLIVLVGFDIYERHHPHYGMDPQSNYAWDDNKPLERIYSQTFQNETVVLDGKEFLNPTFDNVTFIFNGTGAVRIENAHWVDHKGQPLFRFGSRNKLVTSTLSLYSSFLSAGGCTGQGFINLGPNANMDGLPPLQK